jgi:hypothetical protein
LRYGRRRRRSSDEIVYYDAATKRIRILRQHFRTGSRRRERVRARRVVDTAPLEETSPGHYEARISAQQQGYRITSANAALQLPATGFYREIRNETARSEFALLTQISKLTAAGCFRRRRNYWMTKAA